MFISPTFRIADGRLPILIIFLVSGSSVYTRLGGNIAVTNPVRKGAGSCDRRKSGRQRFQTFLHLSKADLRTSIKLFGGLNGARKNT